jgi:hypothetical protein
MEEYIRESGRMVIRKVGEYTLTLMVQSSQVNGRMTEEMVRVLLHGKMVINLWETGKMGKKRV